MMPTMETAIEIWAGNTQAKKIDTSPGRTITYWRTDHYSLWISLVLSFWSQLRHLDSIHEIGLKAVRSKIIKATKTNEPWLGGISSNKTFICLVQSPTTNKCDTHRKHELSLLLLDKYITLFSSFVGNEFYQKQSTWRWNEFATQKTSVSQEGAQSDGLDCKYTDSVLLPEEQFEPNLINLTWSEDKPQHGWLTTYQLQWRSNRCTP